MMNKDSRKFVFFADDLLYNFIMSLFVAEGGNRQSD